jgi:hypothetical protein
MTATSLLNGSSGFGQTEVINSLLPIKLCARIAQPIVADPTLRRGRRAPKADRTSLQSAGCS